MGCNCGKNKAQPESGATGSTHSGRYAVWTSADLTNCPAENYFNSLHTANAFLSAHVGSSYAIYPIYS